MQKYQLVAHIKEGGKPNQWRLKCIAIGNPVHLKCNACDYYSNSVEKLHLHASNQRHETALKLYKVRGFTSFPADARQLSVHFLPCCDPLSCCGSYVLCLQGLDYTFCVCRG